MATKFYLTPQDIYNRATALESQYRPSPYLTRLAKVDLLKEKILNSKHLSARKKRQLFNRLALRENRLRQNYIHQGGAAIPIKKVKVNKKPQVHFQDDARLIASDRYPPLPPLPPPIINTPLPLKKKKNHHPAHTPPPPPPPQTIPNTTQANQSSPSL